MIKIDNEEKTRNNNDLPCGCSAKILFETKE